MLKFFRQIRQQLLKDNQMKKYSIYALGEIFLVVIGILIALQINNWNENRKDILKEFQLIEAIQSNLIEDTENIAKAKERYKTTLKFIERFFQDHPIPDDSLAFVSTRMAGHAPFIQNTTAFDLSINSGNLELIRDKNLIQQLQRLYAFEYLITDDLHHELSKKMDKVKSLTEKYEAFDIKPLVSSDDFYDKTFVLPWNIENLKRRNQTSELRAIIKHMHLIVGRTIKFYNRIEQKNKSLRETINKYLKSNF